MDQIFTTLTGAALTAVTGAAYSSFEEHIKKALDSSIKRLSNNFYNSCKEKKILKEIQKDNFLQDYIIRSYDDIGRAKTFLYDDDNPLIENYCICIDLSYKNNKKKKCIIKTNQVKNILAYSKNIIITGVGGTGKTTLMKSIHINCIKQLDLIPVYIVLRKIKPIDNDKKINIWECIKDTLTTYGAKIDDNLLEISLKKGCYLILFDGFDEMKSDISDIVQEEIVKFARKYNENYYIIASRPYESINAGDDWSGFRVLHTEHLSKKQALELIDKIDYDDKKTNFRKELDEKYYKEHESFASNPLLLTLMLIVYCQNNSIPDDFCDFYGEAFSVLYHRVDARRNLKREIHSKLSSEQLKELFSAFCFLTFFDGLTYLGENTLLNYINDASMKIGCKVSPNDVKDDFCVNLSMLVRDDTSYSFIHRSFQEYFAAMYTTKLSYDEQKRFVLSHLYEIGAGLSEYIVILCKLEKSKFYEIVVVDLLADLKNIYTNGKKIKGRKYDDFEFLLDLVKDLEYSREKGKRKKQLYVAKPKFCEFVVNISRLCVIMSIYNSDVNSNNRMADREMVMHRQMVSFYNEVKNILNNYSIMIEEIFNTYKIESISASELIKKICIKYNVKDELMNQFLPLLQTVKSWIHKKPFRMKAIDLLLEK